MKIAKESEVEKRVALTPEDLKKIKQKLSAESSGNITCAITATHIDPNSLPENTILIGLFDPFYNKEKLQAFAKRNITTFALDMMPRTTRAQSMDVLSSQSSIAGYKAVITAAYHLPQYFPMLTTAAGTITPAKVLILGAGVAGLQAIATAKRLGAVTSAYDIRPEVKEQVESLGAKFIVLVSETNKYKEDSPLTRGDVPLSGTEGSKDGYAKELTEEQKQKQQEELASIIAKHDVVITTALIPGRQAPVLIKNEVIQQMKSGSIIVDLATEKGGNVEGSEKDKVVTKHDITIIGHTNYPSQTSKDASKLYSKNMYNFLLNLLDEKGEININLEDEIISGTLLTHKGEIVHPKLQSN
jgi:H+-translocating NAD(P) transhydrogenase subunit alpha